MAHGHDDAPLNAAGWLRGIRFTMEGITTTGGPYGYDRKRYRRAKSNRVRCHAAWFGRCQRRQNHSGPHWWRKRKRDCWWGNLDPPFSLFTSIRVIQPTGTPRPPGAP